MPAPYGAIARATLVRVVDAEIKAPEPPIGTEGSPVGTEGWNCLSRNAWENRLTGATRRPVRSL